ncbi:hypothetical protein [Paenibacillus sp. SN-8-1]|uniref:hypothetical protein n=1 Tax=Paenibacillus sp. SN-8-1 TaxID=3435409 RepID=UPI003D9A4946
MADEETQYVTEVVEAESSRITIGLNLRKTAELGPAAIDVAAFVNTMREQTQEEYVIDVHVGVGNLPDRGRNADGTAVVGFTAPAQIDDEGEDD